MLALVGQPAAAQGEIADCGEGAETPHKWMAKEASTHRKASGCQAPSGEWLKVTSFARGWLGAPTGREWGW
jgi:hypothetical protein